MPSTTVHIVQTVRSTPRPGFGFGVILDIRRVPPWSVSVSRSSPNSQIDDIIDKLRRAGDPADRDEITRQESRLARLIMAAIRDDQHALCEELTDLQAQVQRGEVGSSAYLSPRPGTSDQKAARFWPLQLLLYCAATHANTGDALRTQLNIGTDSFRKAVAAASGVVDDWNTALLATRLAQAAAHLRWPVDGLPFRIDDKGQLICDGFEPLPLSKQQRDLLQMLMDHACEYVTHEQFHDIGIGDPTACLSDLKKKLGDRPVDIETGRKCLRLKVCRQ